MANPANPKRPVGRPRDPAKVEALLDAGWELFLERGVAAVPIEAVAKKAHVSKGTLYACFADRSELFKAAVKREMQRIEAAQGLDRSSPGSEPLVETLTRFGNGIMRFLASAPAVGFYNALSAELRQHPKLAKAFWDLGPGQTRANLAAILDAASQRGEIVIDGPVAAAEALFGLWQGFSNLQLALALPPQEIDEWIVGRVTRGVEIFLRAHKPRLSVKRTRSMAAIKKTAHKKSGYQGFAPKALEFFNELDVHQSRDWFLKNKERHETLIVAPLGQLLNSLTLALAAQRIPLQGDLKTSVFRINRDVRFSKDKRPYKTNVSVVLTRDGTKRSQGVIYLQLGPAECFIAAGFYALEPEPLEAFRRAIVDHPKKWTAAVTKLNANGLALLRDDAVVRLPRGYQADQVKGLADDIRLKSFVVRTALDAKTLASDALVDEIVTFARSAKPLLEFGWFTLGKAQAADE